nr:MAG TPA: hypothetical protein [Caudoviricetes sp.]
MKQLVLLLRHRLNSTHNYLDEEPLFNNKFNN